MPVTIGIETPLQDDVRALVSALNAHMRPLSPPEFQFQMTVEEMAETSTNLFVARDNAGRAVGIGALRQHDATLGELKRMYVLPEVRGQRIAHQLLEHLVALAAERGVTRLVLETGGVSGFEAAWRLYERFGFERCAAVLDYPDSEYSAFYAYKISPQKVVA